MRKAALMFLALGATVLAAPYSIGDVFASVGGGLVRVYSPTGTLKATLDTTRGGFTTGSTFDKAGNFYVTNFSDQSVSKFDVNGLLVNARHFVTNQGGTESIVFDASGNAYVGNADGNRDVYKFNSAGSFLAQYDVQVTGRGSDWIDLAANQTTLYYTSENSEILRYDLATNTQLPSLTTSLNRPLFALRVRPNGEFLAASGAGVVYRLDSGGNVKQTYDPTGLGGLFALNLDPDGKSFWTGETSGRTVVRFDIESGAELGRFDTGPGSLFGLSVLGEIQAGGGGVGGEVPEPSTYALAGVGVLAMWSYRRRRGSLPL